MQLRKVKAEIGELSNNPQGLLLEAMHSAGYAGALANPLLAPETALHTLNGSILEHFIAVRPVKSFVSIYSLVIPLVPNKSCVCFFLLTITLLVCIAFLFCMFICCLICLDSRRIILLHGWFWQHLGLNMRSLFPLRSHFCLIYQVFPVPRNLNPCMLEEIIVVMQI